MKKQHNDIILVTLFHVGEGKCRLASAVTVSLRICQMCGGCPVQRNLLQDYFLCFLGNKDYNVDVIALRAARLKQ